jgi:HK97 family phage major capsid protein
MPDIDFRALETLIGELDAIPLTGKTPADKQKEVRLLAKIACVRSGMPLRDVQRQELNNYENEHNMPVTRFERPISEKLEEARAFQRFIESGEVELRDSTVGNNPNAPQFLSGNVGNGLVARTFLEGVQAGEKWYDPIFGDICRQIETESGNSIQCGFMSDVNSVAAVVVPENSNQAANEQDPVEVGAVDIGAWSYRTPLWRFSYELLSDLQGMTTALELFQQFSSDRIARGAGANLMTGTGSGMPLGLITSLQLLGTGGTVIAAGSSETTGNGAQTGSNSVGDSDLVNLATSLDPSYAASPSTCWLCNFSTFSSINRILDKYGRPLNLITWQDGKYFLLGSPLYISPSVPSIGAGAVPLLFGDFSYFAVRHARAGDKITIVKEAQGLIEKGEFAMRTWTRLDCALLFGSVSTPPPIVYLTNHS